VTGVRSSVRPFVYLHSDRVIPGCDCGDRGWIVQLGEAFMWDNHAAPADFPTLEAAMDYAVTLHSLHPAVRLRPGQSIGEQL
jgi:hypothetical protein